MHEVHKNRFATVLLSVMGSFAALGLVVLITQNLHLNLAASPGGTLFSRGRGNEGLAQKTKPNCPSHFVTGP